MLINALQEYKDAEEKLWKEIVNDKEEQYFIEHTDVSIATSLLENLIKLRVLGTELPAYELMLKINKDKALTLIKDLYLSQDLANHAKDQVADLKSMFADIKNILGKEELEKVLNSKEFLRKNKKNKRVQEAIKFALEQDEGR
jgi:ethanolamine utilization protein EutA (predicted chaperonin)